jgi:Flp pilus assembly protein TadD
MLYNSEGDNQKAEKTLKQAVAVIPEDGRLHYSLGLLLAEEERLAEASEHLGKAAQLLPDRARVQYNYALTLQHLGKRSEAESALLQAHHVDSMDPGIVNALIILYMQEKRWQDALGFAEKLRMLLPEEPGVQQLINQIQGNLATLP